ncbi:hypothetical protein HDU91_001975, partial [Kappamyces sp. JEL0680]
SSKSKTNKTTQDTTTTAAALSSASTTDATEVAAPTKTVAQTTAKTAQATTNTRTAAQTDAPEAAPEDTPANTDIFGVPTTTDRGQIKLGGAASAFSFPPVTVTAGTAPANTGVVVTPSDPITPATSGNSNGIPAISSSGNNVGGSLITSGGNIDGGLVTGPSSPVEAGSSSPPNSLSPGTTDASPSTGGTSAGSSPLSMGAIIGIAVGGLVLAVVGFVAVRKLPMPGKKTSFAPAPERQSSDNIFRSSPRAVEESDSWGVYNAPPMMTPIAPGAIYYPQHDRKLSLVSTGSSHMGETSSFLPEPSQGVIERASMYSGLAPSVHRYISEEDFFPEDVMSERSMSPGFATIKRQESNLVNAALRMATTESNRESQLSSTSYNSLEDDIFDRTQVDFDVNRKSAVTTRESTFTMGTFEFTEPESNYSFSEVFENYHFKE